MQAVLPIGRVAEFWGSVDLFQRLGRPRKMLAWGNLYSRWIHGTELPGKGYRMLDHDSDSTIPKLIAQARTSREHLGTLFERYRPYLLLEAQRRIGPQLAVREDASDVVQKTEVEALQAFATFGGTTEPEFSAWIRQIHDRNLNEAVGKHVHTEKRSILKERRLPEPTDSASVFWHEPAAQQSTPSQRLIKGERALRLAAILQTLPAGQREAVRLRHLEGWPVAEVAQALDRSIAATAGLIKRGLQALREKMSEDSWQ
jgi:RNA polymerase sigma-70 factor (ECF subfamily)